MASQTRSQNTARLRAAASVAAATLLYGASAGFAGDVQVQNVARGRATVECGGPNGANTIIRAADRTVINYSRFNVPRGSGVQFIQPSASSRVLNRVNSATPSRIDGSITANGRVYLMNPAGVIFGADASVKAAGFYAGAANISDDDFVAGVNRFTLGPGDVLNDGGRIEADVVGLLGRHVGNRGTIVTPGAKGLVAMTAGDGEVMIGEQGGNILVKVNSTGAAPEAVPAGAAPRPGVENTGTIDAGPRGQVSLAAGDIYSLAIRQSAAGQIKAKNVTVQGADRGGIVQVGGKIDASNPSGTGGTVQILGDKIALSNAQVDASGKTGGGTILVGGEYKGGGGVPSASATVATRDTTLRADATHSGDGGRVIVWSDDSTRFKGGISARGGANGGNGGFVETSGGYLDVDGARVDVTAHAPGAAPGTWLLDPSDIFVETDAVVDLILNTPTLLQGFTDLGFNFVDLPADGVFAAPSTAINSVIRVSQINAALDGGTNVTLDASGGNLALFNDPGTILIDAPITKSAMTPGEGPLTLTLIAPAGVDISRGTVNDAGTGDPSDDFLDPFFPGGGIIATAGTLNVVMQVNDLTPSAAAAVAGIPGGIPNAVGDINLIGPVRTNGGDFTATIALPGDGTFRPIAGAAIQFGAAVEVSPRTLPVGAGGTTTRVFESGLIDTTGPAGTRGGNVAISAPRRITFVAPITTGGGNVQINSTGPVSDESTVVVARAVDTRGPAGSAGGSVTVTANGNVRVRQITTAAGAGQPGGAVSLLADRNADGNGNFELLPTLTAIVPTAQNPNLTTLLPQAVNSFIEAGTGAIQIEASQSAIVAGDVRGGSLTVNADVAPVNGVLNGLFSQLTGAIDTGSGPIDMKAANFLLAGGNISGGRLAFGPNSTDPSALSNIVIVPGTSGKTIQSTTAEGIRFNGNIVVTDQPGEDINNNGQLDIVEDINGNGLLDPSEDTPRPNGILDPGEDANGNGLLDAGEDVPRLNNVLDTNEVAAGGISAVDINGNGIFDITDTDINGNGVLDNDEDRNFNRVFDPGEDVNGNGRFDTFELDTNANGVLDPAEDFNSNGRFDVTEFDLNANGVLDAGEDVNGNGRRDAFEFDFNGNGFLDVDEDRNGNKQLDIAEDFNANNALDFGEDFNGNGALDVQSPSSGVLVIRGTGGSTDIVFAGALGGAAQVRVEAGGGDVTFTGPVGASLTGLSPLQSLDVTGNTVTMSSAFTTGTLDIDAAERIQLSGEGVQLIGDRVTVSRLPHVRDEGGALTATGQAVQVLVPTFDDASRSLLRFDVREADIQTSATKAPLQFQAARRAGVSVPNGLFFEAVNPSIGDAVTVDVVTATASAGTARTAAEVIAGSSPQQTVYAVQSAGVAGSIAAELGKVGVFARELDPLESREFLVLGRSFYDDASVRPAYRMVPVEQMMIAEGAETLVGVPVVPGLSATDIPPKQRPEDLLVAANRIPYDEARTAVQAYQQLMRDPVTGELAEDARKEAIREATTNTWLKYQEEAGADKASGAGYRAYIEARADEDAETKLAVDAMAALQRTLRSVELLGLTPRELGNAKGVLLRDIRPIEETGMTAEVFEDAVRAGTMPAMSQTAPSGEPEAPPAPAPALEPAPEVAPETPAAPTSP